MDSLRPLVPSLAEIDAPSSPLWYYIFLVVERDRHWWWRRYGAHSAAVADVDCDVVVDFGSISYFDFGSLPLHHLFQLIHHL